MGWLRSVASIKLQVSFAEYSLFSRALLQKRPMISSILLTKATAYQGIASARRMRTNDLPNPMNHSKIFKGQPRHIFCGSCCYINGTKHFRLITEYIHRHSSRGNQQLKNIKKQNQCHTLVCGESDPGE